VRILSIAIGIVFLALSSCGPRFAGHGNYEIRGSLVDAETGAPVSRKEIYLHVSNDAIKDQTAVEREDESTFTVRVLRPDVRLRVYDPTNQYQLYETRLIVPKPGLDTVVRLVPTHYVVLKGRLLVDKDGSWVPIPEPEYVPGAPHLIGGQPLLSFDWEGGGTSWSAFHVDENGAFEVRLPRALVRVVVLDTGLNHDPPFIDLTRSTVDVIERDIHLVDE